MKAVITAGTYPVEGLEPPEQYHEFLRRNEQDKNDGDADRQLGNEDFRWVVSRIFQFCESSSAKVEKILVRPSSGGIVNFTVYFSQDPDDIQNDANALIEELLERWWSGIHILTVEVPSEQSENMERRPAIEIPHVREGMTASPYSNATIVRPLRIAAETVVETESINPLRPSKISA